MDKNKNNKDSKNDKNWADEEQKEKIISSVKMLLQIKDCNTNKKSK